ncbi:MAG TPA: class I SAM-dependent methyltransferase [Candidatus Paceibacterota bacterium]
MEYKDKEFDLANTKKYAEKKWEIDKAMEEFSAPFIEGKQLSVLDACSGVGQIAYYLAKRSPESKFLGVDHAPFYTEEAQKLYSGQKNLSFETEDIYKLPEKYPKEFDVTISHKTITWQPYYTDIMKAMFAVTKKHIFISSLFYDEDIDFEINIREYKKEGAKDGFNSQYNVYSFPRFKDFAFSLGAKNIEAQNFEIGIDVPKPPAGQVGTYTVKTENGHRLQISGIILMLWKFIRIDLA